MDIQDVAVPDLPEQGSPGGIQSVVRAMTTLETIASQGGVLGVSQIAARSGLSVPTVHRIVRTLVDLGYLRQEPSRLYALGPRLLLLADSSSATMRSTAQRHLARLVDELGETANLAVLDGSQVAYVAQVPSRHAMRMFTEVGKRVMPHCTAVGKALLLGLPADEVRVLLSRNGMPRRTDMTITDARRLPRAARPGGPRRLRARRRRAGDRGAVRRRARPRALPCGWRCRSPGRRRG